MDQVARAAFITAMAACCSAKLAAMQEQNVCDRAAGRPVSYTPDDFETAPDQFGLGHNAVISYLQDY